MRRLPSASIAAPAIAAALTNLLLAATKSNGRTTAASRSAVRDAESLALSVPVSITANGLALGATSLASAAGASSNIHLLCWGLTWCGVTPAMLLGRAAFASDSYRYLDPAADHRLWSAPGRMLHQAPSSCSRGRVEAIANEYLKVMAAASISALGERCVGVKDAHPPRVLLLGLGGGTLLALLASLYRGAEFRAVELDAAVLEAAKRYLGLSEAVVSPASLTCGDAVEFARYDRQPYDVILVDAFGSDNATPPAFYGDAFLRDCRALLAPGGTLVHNFHTGSAALDTAFAAATASYKRAFAGRAAAVPVSGQGNTILVASAAPSDTPLAADAQASAAAEAEGHWGGATDTIATDTTRFCASWSCLPNAIGRRLGAPPDAVDLARKLLRFNPARRPDVRACLRHAWMADFTTGDEQTCPAALEVPIDDDTKFSVSDYRDRLYKDVVARRKDRAARMAAYFPKARDSASASRASTAEPGPKSAR
ncbi:hypothetical protein EMIHUDRAFT_203619 [Emiliania huxleyi CCMP1516]|uniref:PABS domain-containing protein n=2 Tax=Emiliania huxleyi TaxID=2903 RepID=A0A0D3K2Z9_EMIH1|nr:hypothetical protein EMIHUDRAFT_203619 [Emiliania huxleyi CCMP1516]EOD30134.1 hypothetical protein EMIHUDRAFT_203619 [Emiliania huxleyi CCMP1516]|eukprot:XP_005782563.1 hypothetical protein EMIHUDRAFT_203619 [Emiliania huxleyi CCMP1516]